MERYMKLSEYFETAEGVGVLATADAHGKVDAALYGRPHFFDDETLMQSIFSRKWTDMKAGGCISLKFVKRRTAR
jgi:hypothetical protein